MKQLLRSQFGQDSEFRAAEVTSSERHSEKQTNSERWSHR